MERIQCSWQPPSPEDLARFPKDVPRHLAHGDNVSECDSWQCICGNQAHLDGFATCLENGTAVEPLVDGPWTRHYICNQCGRVIDGETGEVIFIASEAVLEANCQSA